MFQPISTPEIEEQALVHGFIVEDPPQLRHGEHGKEEVRQPGVMVDDPGVREHGELGGFQG